MSANFLKTIYPTVVERVKNIERLDGASPVLPSFTTIFQQKQPVVIAEVKFASPSKGQIYPGELDHIMIAAEYLQNGASALSILTEPHYFKGHIQYVKDIREHFPQSVLLLKDFIIDFKQIAQAQAAGANAILLMTSFLSKKQLKDLYHYALDIGITPLIEIGNKSDLDHVLELNPKVVGVNNRNMHSLAVDISNAQELIHSIPKEIMVVAESGINNGNQIKLLQALGFKGFLVGSSLMAHAHPGKALSHLLVEVQSC